MADRAPFFSHLARHNVQFDAVIYEQIDQYKLSLYRLLILFDLRAMGSDTADRLRAFVRRGGNLIATGPTGIARHYWQPREESCLSDLLGISASEGPGDRVEGRFGKGQVVFYPDSIGEKLAAKQLDSACRQFIDDVIRLEGEPVCRIVGPDGVLATVMGKGRNKIIVHLMNYRHEAAEPVTVSLPGCNFPNVSLLSPDRTQPTLEGVENRPDGVSFVVRDLRCYAVAAVSRT